MEDAATGDERHAARDRFDALQRELEAGRAREQALRESEARYRALSEESLAGVYVLQDGNFVYMNEPGARMFGGTREELLNRSFESLVTPETIPVVHENIRRRLAGEVRSVHYRLQVQTLHGEVRDVSFWARRCVGRTASDLGHCHRLYRADEGRAATARTDSSSS
jgi:PAS domain S-box-containing protein